MAIYYGRIPKKITLNKQIQVELSGFLPFPLWYETIITSIPPESPQPRPSGGETIPKHPRLRSDKISTAAIKDVRNLKMNGWDQLLLL